MGKVTIENYSIAFLNQEGKKKYLFYGEEPIKNYSCIPMQDFNGCKSIIEKLVDINEQHELLSKGTYEHDLVCFLSDCAIASVLVSTAKRVSILGIGCSHGISGWHLTEVAKMFNQTEHIDFLDADITVTTDDKKNDADFQYDVIFVGPNINGINITFLFDIISSKLKCDGTVVWQVRQSQNTLSFPMLSEMFTTYNIEIFDLTFENGILVIKNAEMHSRNINIEKAPLEKLTLTEIHDEIVRTKRQLEVIKDETMSEKKQIYIDYREELLNYYVRKL